MKNKNNQPIYLALAVIFGLLIGVSLNGSSTNMLSLNKNSSQELKIKRLINFIEKDYVDTVNTESLLDGAITQMLGKLDPHSVYIPKENLQAVTENMQGNFVGIGVQFRMINDSITVIQPIKGGPSIKAGIKAGDRILMANADTLYGKDMFTDKVPGYLKGKPDTKVALKIYRKSIDSTFTVSVTRGNVNIKSVDLAYMINDSLGYIKLDRFARNTYREFQSSLHSLIDDGMKDLVLDLRGNGGGFVDIATSIIDEFLEDDKLIVFTKNNKNKIEESFATDKGDFEKGGLYVLIDENSASASEIVAGALQDNDKGTIIGRRSFGKGLVQIEMDLGDGSAVRLTTARYYTPTGRSIQKPYNHKGNKNYYNDFQNRIANGELLSRDSIKVVDSLKFTTPKGKVVYGGGGIIPDVFVPIDTTSYMTSFYFNSVNNFAFDYVDNNRKKLQKWTIDSFITDFDKDESVFDTFLSSIKETSKPSLKTKQSLKKYLNAAIANTLFGDVGFYRIMHQDDKMIQKVLELESGN
ncbi:S41 family peptidase [Polaribacter sp. Z014]|uniref:S41 family peptidase n=1 Tax=unclassified Polaribacter TaxID=196858 RepID=UPI00193B0256|nr:MULTISPECIES: S41 family peptidase [unclassified Polaribacter]MCL7761981.1 S41 family peptidase [Polaribacter sp. Z014]QVY64590.1 S41 family peptidase [Polaribacter sp. Q13]